MAQRNSNGRRYPPEFREQVLALHRAGRSAYSVAKEFDLAYDTVLNWIKQAELHAGKRSDGVTTEEREELRKLRRANRAAKARARDPVKSRDLVRSGDRFNSTEVFRFVKTNQAKYPVATMCRVLEVSTSGYYAWLVRP